MKHLNSAIFGWRYQAFISSFNDPPDSWAVIDLHRVGFGSVMPIPDDAFIARNLTRDQAFELAEKLSAEWNGRTKGEKMVEAVASLGLSDCEEPLIGRPSRK